MDGEVVVTGLSFPEGPVWLNGDLFFVEIHTGRVSRWTADAGVALIAETGGGPNGATLGSDGALYVTQNGGSWSEAEAPPAIQRVTLGGEVETVTNEVAGHALGAPNDLAFGPDRRLYFTDPRGAPDPDDNQNPGRIFVWDVAAARGELVMELGPVFPNGIAFTADGTLHWTESFSHRVMKLEDGIPRVVIELPERHYPDGMCVGADRRLYVASTYAHCVTVVENGEIVDRLMCGDGMVTNCCFGETDLYVTESRRGTLWRFAIGQPGLALLPAPL